MIWGDQHDPSLLEYVNILTFMVGREEINSPMDATKGALYLFCCIQEQGSQHKGEGQEKQTGEQEEGGATRHITSHQVQEQGQEWSNNKDDHYSLICPVLRVFFSERLPVQKSCLTLPYDSNTHRHFFEQNVHWHFLKILQSKDDGTLIVQVLQTLNIMFENVRSRQSLCKCSNQSVVLVCVT